MGYQTDRPRAADIEEQIGLLNTQNARKRTRRKIVYTTLGALALLTIAVVAFTVPTPRTHKRNLIIMISDGFGPASETYGRSFFQFINNLPENYTTPLDDILVGASRTRSSDSLVTDSAAGATAFSCALKTYNGAIGVDPSGKPCGTVLEAAKARHMHTGLVVTSRITHATPGAFSAHVLNRNEEEAIAVQQIGDNPLGRTVDLMFGGGACFFLPNTTVGSCRSDERDLFTEAGKYGWSIMKSRAEFDQLSADKTQLPLMGLFASDHMDYEIDRDPNRQPALHEMAEKALAILDQHSDNGFFLMIEGSRIDMAAHTNDPAAHVHDILEYHRTVQIVLDYVNSHPDTVMISVSDHETGGFTLGLQINETYPDYIWYPQVIQAVTNSTESLARTLLDQANRTDVDFIREEIYAKGLGILDPTKEELDYLIDPNHTSTDIAGHLGRAVSKRAFLGWTTHGHSGVDVNLYAYGQDAERLRGNHENIDIGNFIVDFLDLDLDTITDRLNQASTFTRRSHSFQDTFDERYHHLQ